jgi:hypothetical protein
MMASTVATNVSMSTAPLSANPSTNRLRLRAQARMMASAYNYEDSFGRTIQRSCGIRQLAGRGRPYAALIEQPDLARRALAHVGTNRSWFRRAPGTCRPARSERGRDRAEKDMSAGGHAAQGSGRAPIGALARRAAGRRSGRGLSRKFPAGDPNGLDRRRHSTIEDAVGRGPLDRRNRPPHGRVEERDRREGASPRSTRPPVSHPAIRGRCATGNVAKATARAEARRHDAPPRMQAARDRAAGPSARCPCRAATPFHGAAALGSGRHSALLLANR